MGLESVKPTRLQSVGRQISSLNAAKVREIVAATDLTARPAAAIGNRSADVFRDILQLQPSSRGEYELSDKEAATMRRRLYSINKNNAVGAKWRTMREGRLLMVWRIW